MGIKKIVLSWMLIASLLLAQRITNIKYEGLAHLSPAMATEISGVRVGDQMDSAKIDTSIKNFFEQGYFKDVWVTKNGGTLTYHFDEKTAIANIEITGYGSGDDGKKLLETIGLKKGDLYDKSKINRAKKTIISNLEAKGNYDSVVDVKTSPVGNGAVSVVFDINKGEKIKIKKLNFVGASKISKSELETSLANQEEDLLGFLPFFFHNGEVKVDQLEYDAYRVKDTYMKHGYLDAEVSKPLMRVDYSSYSAEVDYQIKEGVQYRVGKVSVSQNIKGLNSAELVSDLRLKDGKIFNIKKLRKDMEMLKTAAGDLGYAYAKVSPNMHKMPEKQTVDIQYVMEVGQKVTINDVLISGNDTTKDRVVRRYIYLAPGDTFNATDLKDSKNALGRTGFFEKVDIQSQRVSEDKINLLVKVKETSTGTISAGGGYGSYEGLMVNASISDKNLLGSGLTSTVGFEFSKVSKKFNLSFVNPRVWDSLYSLGVSFSKQKYDYYKDEPFGYSIDSVGGSVNIGREFLRHFFASVGVGYMDNKSEYNDASNLLAQQFYTDQYKKTSFFASIKFDNTDDFYLPREGFIIALNTEYAQMDGDISQLEKDRGYTKFDDFTKINAKFGAYYGLRDWIDYDLVFRFKARYTKILSGSDEYIPINEKLQMGGIGSVRGYQPYSLTPRVEKNVLGQIVGASNNINSYGYPIGGTQTASATVEASIPLSEAAKMRLAFFYDYGVISTDDVPSINGNISFGDISRSSTGVVLEWQSGFGPINLVFALPLDDKPGDQTASFEFSMGTKF